MTNLQTRLVAVVGTQRMKRQELIDYISIEGWPFVEETLDGLLTDGTLHYDAQQYVTVS